MIRVENLHKNFGELEVLKGINIEVSKGEVIAIIGPSGSFFSFVGAKVIFSNTFLWGKRLKC